MQQCRSQRAKRAVSMMMMPRLHTMPFKLPCRPGVPAIVSVSVVDGVLTMVFTPPKSTGTSGKRNAILRLE